MSRGAAARIAWPDADLSSTEYTSLAVLHCLVSTP